MRAATDGGAAALTVAVVQIIANLALGATLFRAAKA